jgi:hypothetical protein
LRQKPRERPSSSYQRRPPAATNTRSACAHAEDAAVCPWVRRQRLQWQRTTSRNGPDTSYRTAPQRQPPVPLMLPPTGFRDRAANTVP